MTGRPQISVVMPAYNAERFIARAIASVRASTCTEWELLVLDDGSTDETLNIAQDAARHDARVRVLQLPHGGVAAARNAGLQAARAELIANLDADDIMFPHRLERQIMFLATHPQCVAVGSRALVINENDTPITVKVRCLSHAEIDATHLACRPGAIWNPTAVFRREAALRINGYSADLRSTGEDFDLWLRMAEVGELANMPEVLSCYRQHNANTSMNKSDAERRFAVTLASVQRAVERRGLPQRKVERQPAPPMTKREVLCDRALYLYFTGNRRKALVYVLAAFALGPTQSATRSALRAIMAAPSMAIMPKLASFS